MVDTITIINYEIRLCSPETERDLFYASTHRGEPGYAGYCRGYFPRGGGFTNSWFDVNDALYETIREDVRNLMTALIEKGPLRNHEALSSFCRENVEACLSEDRGHHGFIVETALCIYYLNLNTTPGDYCVYVNCRVK